MKRQVHYLMSYPAHLPYLVVSLKSLRRHYDGEIVVNAWDESIGIVEEIAMDTDLNIIPKRNIPEYRGKNDQFLHKLRIIQNIDANVGIYLDADTMVMKELEPLFLMAEDRSFCATQFCGWETSGGVVQNRIKRLVGREGIRQSVVRELLAKTWPSLNGGIWAARPSSLALAQWEQWTSKVLDIFIADETVLHAVMAAFCDRDDFYVLRGGEFNCSPKFKPKTLKHNEVGIWHFHGDCNLRPKKSLLGFQLWWPEYQNCLNANVGRIRDWISQIQYKFLRSAEDEYREILQSS